MSNIFTPRTGNNPKGSGPSLPTNFSFLRLPAFIIAAAVFFIYLAWPFKIIDQGDVGVKLRWGEARGILQPGFHIVLPGMEHVVILTTRTQKRTYEKVNSYSRDIQQGDNLITVNYRMDPAKAVEVYARYGESYAASIIDPVIYKRFKEIFGKYDAADIVNQREKLGQEVENNIRQNMPPGIIIEGVQIENIDFSATYEEAIEAAATAEASVRKARQELEQKKVDAEKTVVQAQADATRRKLDRNDIATFHGQAVFVDPHRIAIESSDGSRRTCSAAAIILAVGSRPSRPSSIPFDDQLVFDTDSVLFMERIPRTLAVIGAGVVGCEYASIFASLGVKVTLLDTRSNILDFLDDELKQRLLYRMLNAGVVMHFGEEVVVKLQRRGSHWQNPCNCEPCALCESRPDSK